MVPARFDRRLELVERITKELREELRARGVATRELRG
jgi:hypothetical protein